MNFSTNKEKGNTGLGIAIAYYTSNGYTVSIPLNDTQDYDLIVDKSSFLKKIQIKTTGCKTKYGKYQVALKSCGGTKGKTYKTLIETNVDELFILTKDLSILNPLSIICSLVVVVCGILSALQYFILAGTDRAGRAGRNAGGVQTFHRTASGI